MNKHLRSVTESQCSLSAENTDSNFGGRVNSFVDCNQINISSLDVSYSDVTEIKIALFNTQSEFKF